MKRANYIILRSIISKVKYTIKAIILLPIRIVLFPFKLLSRAVFYLGHRNKYRRLDKDVYNELKKQSKDITENKWDNKRAIADIKQDIVLFSSDLKDAFKSIEDLNKDVYKDITTWMNITVDNQRDINELQLSLESLKPIDLGDFNFISDEPTQIELAQIEAELYGESVARKEYDWHREQKAKDKQIQDRMRKDEAKIKEIDIESNNTMAMNGDIPDFLDD